MKSGPCKLAIFNNKGGVGKSTIAVHAAYGLASRGKRVLLLDMDEQNDASLFLGFTSEDYIKTLKHMNILLFSNWTNRIMPWISEM